jgi:pyruvate,water dikinase
VEVSFVLTLAEAADAASAGGKGASLGELARAGVAVPPGFVVTVDAFATAMAGIDPDGALRAEVEALPAADLPGIAARAAALRARIAETPLPDSVASAVTTAYAALGGTVGGLASPQPDVAVRSSATMEDSSAASFAGLQDTYLGVAGASSVLGHVRRCWASLYNDESVAYRRRLAMPEASLAMAVVVQRMVRPRAAGVMFTRSPVTGDRSVVAIEGTWGLGSALVAGDVTPDSFVISKITGEITGRRVSDKDRVHSFLPNGRGVAVTDTPASLREAPCLTDDEVRALAAIGRKVEAHYGAPQDIEWALLEDEPGAAPAASAGASPASLAPPASAASPASQASATDRIVLLQSRPETVWAARAATPVAAPKRRAADHVLALFGKQL